MRRTLKKEIVWSNIIIIFLVIITMLVLINTVAKRTLRRSISEDLYNDAKLIQTNYLINFTDRISEKEIRRIFSSQTKINRLKIESKVGLVNLSTQKVHLQDGKTTIKIPSSVKSKADNFTHLTKQSTFVFNHDNQEYLGVLLRARNIPKNKALLLLYIPFSAINDLYTLFFKVAAMPLIAVVLFVIIMGLLISRRIAKPIVKLESYAKEVAERNYRAPVPKSNIEEIHSLGISLETMSMQLMDYDQSQKKFLQNASHELKTPLMSIQGYAEGIKDGVFPADDPTLDVIIDESIRLKKLVEELIYLTKLESLETFYEFKTINLNDVITEAIKKIYSIATKASISIVYDKNIHNPITVNGDFNKLVQVFINILSNSIRYANSTIKITVIKEEKSLIIDITDDGNGFTSEDLNSIFDRFYKGQNGQSGLGMPIVKAIINKHNGNIQARNTPNKKGAQFIIELPFYN